MGKVILVLRGLKNNKATESDANKFFKKEGFGSVKKVMAIKTLAGNGGSGGRSDIVFVLTSPNIMKFGLSPFRFSSGASWGSDYIDNDNDIIPEKDKVKLNILINRYGG